MAAFRESNLPVLLCSEAGGEGRNFQFCKRMLHYDLPLDPVELEQRIGRLDRIGRQQPVEILYFRERDAAPDVARLYEKLGLFERPGAGLDPALAALRPALETACANATPLDEEALVEEVEAARRGVASALTRVLYRDAYTPEQASSVLMRVPPDLEEQTRTYCVAAAQDLGFEVVEKSDVALYYIEIGAESTVDGLPGVAGGGRFLGTFDRSEALSHEEMDFFASGHPLVEGLLLELEDGVRGRAALIELPEGTLPGAGMLCVSKQGPSWEALVFDERGVPRPEWLAPLFKALPQARDARMEGGNEPVDWTDWAACAERVRALAASPRCPSGLVAAAYFRESVPRAGPGHLVPSPG